jgi:hypothetical protein
MNILSWNTAGNLATAAALRLAESRNVDVLLLQEAQPDFSTEAAIGGVVPGLAWGSWILARSGTLTPVHVHGYSGWLAGAVWSNGAGNDYYVFSLHSPTTTTAVRRRSYIAEARLMVSAICDVVPRKAALIIGGDFNFRSFGERLNVETLRTTRPELAALREFRAHGFCVVWRDTRPEAPLPQTLRWRRAPATPFHCDGFLTRNIEPTRLSGDVLQPDDIAEVRLSDHNPLLLRVA